MQSVWPCPLTEYFTIIRDVTMRVEQVRDMVATSSECKYYMFLLHERKYMVLIAFGLISIKGASDTLCGAAGNFHALLSEAKGPREN